MELERAIANLTRLLGSTDNPETAAALAMARRAIRRELDDLRGTAEDLRRPER
jgi:hypothetical protein